MTPRFIGFTSATFWVLSWISVVQNAQILTNEIFLQQSEEATLVLTFSPPIVMQKQDGRENRKQAVRTKSPFNDRRHSHGSDVFNNTRTHLNFLSLFFPQSSCFSQIAGQKSLLAPRGETGKVAHGDNRLNMASSSCFDVFDCFKI